MVFSCTVCTRESEISNLQHECGKKTKVVGGGPCIGPMKCRIETPSDVARPNGYGLGFLTWDQEGCMFKFKIRQ